MTKRPPTANGAAEHEIQRFSMRIKTFCVYADMNERQVYRLIDKGVLKSFKVGRMRMINVEEYRKMVSE